MRRFWRENSLSITLFAIFLMLWVCQAVVGWHDYNATQLEHQQETVGFGSYLGTGHFVEATFENWESEFLQMGAYVLMTAFLYQKGSAESKPLDEDTPQDQEPGPQRGNPDAPGPVQHGGWRLSIYKHSLSLTFFALFAFAFSMHALGGMKEYNGDQMAHGEPPISLGAYLVSARFWFESFQNWQSEFLAVGSIVVLSIVLREQGSPESKPVASPHSETGSA